MRAAKPPSLYFALIKIKQNVGGEEGKQIKLNAGGGGVCFAAGEKQYLIYRNKKK